MTRKKPTKKKEKQTIKKNIIGQKPIHNWKMHNNKVFSMWRWMGGELSTQSIIRESLLHSLKKIQKNY